MKSRNIVFLLLVVLVAVAGAIWLRTQIVKRDGDTERPAVASSQLNNRELRFAPGSPQLSFIKVEGVQALPEPLLDPLNARVAYDENHTARVSSPLGAQSFSYEYLDGAGNVLLTSGLTTLVVQ